MKKKSENKVTYDILYLINEGLIRKKRDAGGGRNPSNIRKDLDHATIPNTQEAIASGADPCQKSSPSV